MLDKTITIAWLKGVEEDQSDPPFVGSWDAKFLMIWYEEIEKKIIIKCMASDFTRRAWLLTRLKYGLIRLANSGV